MNPSVYFEAARETYSATFHKTQHEHYKEIIRTARTSAGVKEVLCNMRREALSLIYKEILLRAQNPLELRAEIQLRLHAAAGVTSVADLPNARIPVAMDVLEFAWICVVNKREQDFINTWG